MPARRGSTALKLWLDKFRLGQLKGKRIPIPLPGEEVTVPVPCSARGRPGQLLSEGSLGRVCVSFSASRKSSSVLVFLTDFKRIKEQFYVILLVCLWER